jgi:hypothetical protein
MCETGWIVRASSRTAASTRSSRGGDVRLLAQAVVRFTLASGNEAPTSHPLRVFPFAEVTAGFPRPGADCRNDMPLQTRRRRQNGRHRPKAA